jgi:hypothetical protein
MAMTPETGVLDASAGAGTGKDTGVGPVNTIPVQPPIEPHPDLSPLENVRPAGYRDPTPTRAIRMPNGHFLFTNRPEYGGEEVSVGDAGKEIRSRDAAQPGIAQAASRPIDPLSSTMSGLIQASTRAALQRGGAGPVQPMRGKMVRGQDTFAGLNDPYTPADATAGRPGVSMIEGTPDQKMAAALQDAVGLSALNEATQRATLFGMSPERRAMIENPQIQTLIALERMYGPKRDKAMSDASELSRAASTPGSAAYIADPKLRKQRLYEIQMDLDATLAPIRDAMSVPSKQRLPQT